MKRTFFIAAAAAALVAGSAVAQTPQNSPAGVGDQVKQAPRTGDSAQVGGTPSGNVKGRESQVVGSTSLTPEARTRIRGYVAQHRYPSVAVPGHVAVGTVLPPEARFYAFEGVEGVGPYSYAYINDAPVLVDPGSRRVIEIIE
jgi:Protein of unknown function (DUF1236)